VCVCVCVVCVCVCGCVWCVCVCRVCVCVCICVVCVCVGVCVYVCVSISVDARSKACLCGLLLADTFQIRISPEAWMFVCCDCCMLSGRGLCDEPIAIPEESYRVWCVWVWSRSPVMGSHDSESGRTTTGNKYICSASCLWQVVIFSVQVKHTCNSLKKAGIYDPKPFGFVCNKYYDIVQLFGG